MAFCDMRPAEQIVAMINRVYTRGMTTTSGGNLSIRDSEGNIWITPSGIDKGSLTVEDICLVTADGKVSGKYKPSCELPFHTLVYKTFPKVNAILHAHPAAAVSYSLTRTVPQIDILPSSHFECGQIGNAGYEVPGSIALGENIVRELSQGADVVVMENHGVVAVAGDMLSAFKRFETFENTAKAGILARTLGSAVVLSAEELQAYADGIVAADDIIDTTCYIDDMARREELCRLSQRAYVHGLFTSTQGSFSVRLSADTFLITPDNIDRSALTAEDIVLVHAGAVEHGKTPSKDYRAHAAIYRDHSEVMSVTTAVSPAMMAFAVTHSELHTGILPESYIMMRTLVRLPFGSAVLSPDSVSAAVTPSHPVLLIDNDCVLTTGGSPINAFDRLEVAEFTAQTIISAMGLGGVVSITQQDIERINVDFCLPN